MSIKTALDDTGPLVALLHRDDPLHSTCDAIAETIRLPLKTCLPVITEAAYLLRRHPTVVRTLLSQCAGQIFELLPLTADDVAEIAAILVKYADQDFDFADAALMHLAVREGISTIFTLDRRHFSVFRTAQGKSLTVTPHVIG